jgi:hypothetical protein
MNQTATHPATSGVNDSNVILISLLKVLHKANDLVTSKHPGAICVQAASPGVLAAIPNFYKMTFRDAQGSGTFNIEATVNVANGQITWSPITSAGPILGVGGTLMQCVVDIYPALRAIHNAGYTNPVYFCGLFQAVVPHIYVPWYCFTPNNCASSSSSNYIFVNSITAEVRIFPTENYRG